MADIEFGTIYKHTSGAWYIPVAITNDNGEGGKPDYPPTVAYVGETGKSYSRRVDEWDRSMTRVAYHEAVDRDDPVHDWNERAKKTIVAASQWLTDRQNTFSHAVGKQHLFRAQSA